MRRWRFQKKILYPYLKYAPGNFVVKVSHNSELFEKLQIFLAFRINFLGFIAVCMKQILIDVAISPMDRLDAILECVSTVEGLKSEGVIL